MKLWFETHSTSVHNEQGIASGHLDTPLSELGRRQAAEMGLRYADVDVLMIYTSDLTRAVSTAQIAFGESEIARAADPRLRECDYGSWSGMTAQQLQDTRSRFIEKPFPEGESFRDVVRRVGSFLNDVPRREGTVLIIGHRAPWYALEHLLNGRDLHDVVTSDWKWQPGWEYQL